MPDESFSFKAGVQAYQEGAYNHAIELFSKVIREKPKDFHAFYNRAVCYYNLQYYSNAKEDLLYIHHNVPPRRNVLSLLMKLATEQQDSKEASFWRKRLERLATEEEKGGEHKDGKENTWEIKGGDRTIVDSDGIIKQIKFFKSDIKFKDVIGANSTKRYLYKNIVLPLQRPEIYKKYGKKMGLGTLLYGCSGTGKSWLCKAVAGEANANIINMKVHEIMSAFVGLSEKNIAGIFEFARKNAPTIILIDELDGVAGKRHSSDDSKGEGSAMRNVINSLLAEMSGLESNPEGLFVIGTTNRPYDVDPAIKRSGRFDNTLYIQIPKLTERKGLFQYYLGKLPKIGKINYMKLALLTNGYSQADIARLCDISLLEPIMTEINTNASRMLTTQDVMRTIKTEMPVGSALQWFQDTYHEILWKERIQIIDKKVVRNIESGSLDSNEKLQYKPLIRDAVWQTSSTARLVKTLSTFASNIV